MDAHTPDLLMLPAERRRFLHSVGHRLTGLALMRREAARRHPILILLGLSSQTPPRTGVVDLADVGDADCDSFLTAASDSQVTPGRALAAATTAGALRPAVSLDFYRGLLSQCYRPGFARWRRPRSLSSHTASGAGGIGHQRMVPLRALSVALPFPLSPKKGRWSPASPAIYGYIREARRWNQYPNISL